MLFSLVFVRRQARDSPPLAPGARPQEVDMQDIQEERPPRPATDRPRGQRPRRPVGPGESPVQRIHVELLKLRIRVSARTVRTTLLRHGLDRLHAGQADVERVPPFACLRHPGLRFLHCGDAPAEDALCLVLHRGLDEASARGGRLAAAPRHRLGTRNEGGSIDRDVLGGLIHEYGWAA
jgi:hypothetical protein